MSIDERSISLPAQWAAEAHTAIPNPPLPGQAYRNTAVDAADLRRGQLYDRVYDSARHNQFNYLLSGLLRECERFGVPPWSSQTDYPEGALCLGLDGTLYQAMQASGPGLEPGPQKPAQRSEYWQQANLGATRNPGELVFSLLPLEDAGLHLLDGSLLAANGMYAEFVELLAGLRAAHPGLFITESQWQAAVADYGVCGKFVYDEAAATLRLPKVTGFVEGTLDSAALGDLTEAGLPGINGTIRTLGSSLAEATGAFFIPSTTSNVGGHPSSDSKYQNFIGLNASLSSPIYGKSTTVQPQSIKGYLYIVLANRIISPVQVNAERYANDVNALAGRLQRYDTLIFPGALVDWYSPNLPARLRACNGALLENASVAFPALLDGLKNNPFNRGMTIAESDWQARSAAAGGVGGVPFFVLDETADTIRLPDLRGDYERIAGGGSMAAAGDWHGDAIRNITGTVHFPNFRFPSEPSVTGAYYNLPESPAGARFSGSGSYTDWHFPGFDASLVVPTASENRTRAFGKLKCVYTGE